MILFLVYNYFLNSVVFIIVLTIFPILLGMNTGSVVTQAFVWGGIFGGLYTLYNFNHKNIWPLYDNLRYPKYLLIFALFMLLQIINIIISQLF